MTTREYLTPDEWEQFCKLYEKVEGTTWQDTRDLAFMLLPLIAEKERARLCEDEMRKDRVNITTILETVVRREAQMIEKA
jgi:hypothetical protein